MCSLDVFRLCDKCNQENARIHRVQWVATNKLSLTYKCQCGNKFVMHKHTKKHIK